MDITSARERHAREGDINEGEEDTELSMSAVLRYGSLPLRRRASQNPTSPLGVGGLERFVFHLPLFLFGEGFTPPAYPLPLGLDGGGREASDRPRWPKLAPREPQRAQDGLQDRSR